MSVSYAQQPVERVEITGSNIRRIDAETALPVQIITKEEIEKTGAANVEQFLQQQGVAVQGNSNSVAATASGATSGGVSGVSLRGLGSQRTLVLIDGRRVSGGGTITDSTTVDVNQIPASAIERIEILKDGASAIYGSDAIGGVINFILRKDYRGGEVTGSVGITEKHGGSNVRGNGVLGWGSLAEDGFNATIFVNGMKEQAIFGRDRGFANKGIFPDVQNDTTSGNTFPANTARFPPPGTSTRNPFRLATGSCGSGPYATADDFFFPATRCRFDPSPLVALIPETKQTGFMANLRKKISAEMEGYAQLSYSYKEQRTVIQPVPLSDQFNLPNNNPLFNQFPYNQGLVNGGPANGFAFSTIVLQPTSLFYPQTLFPGLVMPGAGGNYIVRYRSAETGNRDITNISEQPRIVLGLKGAASGWDYDASFLHTETLLRERVNNGFPILSKILPLLNSGTVNFFGPNTPAVSAQLQATQFHGNAYKTKTSIDGLSAKASRDLTQLSGGPLALAIGVEGRREGFTTTPAAEIQQGDVSGYGGNFLPQNKGRNVTAGFTEIVIPVLKSLELSAAARYDNYQGTGSKTTPKFGARFQPVQQFLLRGSWGRGFRAPSLTELYQPATVGVSAPGLNDPLRCPTTGSSTDCGTQFPITVGGKTDLKSETSRNLTWGFLAEPTKNISFGIDWFDIKLKNPIIFGITPATMLATAQSQATYAAFITRAAPDPGCPGCPGQIVNIDQTNLNLGEQLVKGFDAQFKFRLPTSSWGDFTLSMNGTRFTKYEIQNPDGTFSSIRGMVNPIVNGAGGVIPVWRHLLSLDWKRGPWGVTLQESYQRGYYDLPGTNEDPACAFGPPCIPQIHTHVARYDVYNLFGSYTGWKDARVSVGIRNLFNANPPYTNAGGQNWFQAGYDPGYADPRGRLFFASLTYKFQ